MNARRAARELSLILFSQLTKKADKLDNEKIINLLLKTVITMTSVARDELELTTSSLLEMQEYLDNLEIEHPANLKRPIDSENLPVPIPLTSDMNGMVNSLLNVAEKSFQAIEIAEMVILSQSNDVFEYIIKIIKNYKEHQDEIKDQIANCAIGWDISRLIKIDHDILNIAVTELLYVQDAPIKVVIDEAVELAKKYSTEDSSSFINGVLGQIVKTNALK